MYGFKFHHAEGDNAKMVLWLRDGPSKVPIFASHHAGVGCVVMHEDNILVVKEKSNNKVQAVYTLYHTRLASYNICLRYHTI